MENGTFQDLDWKLWVLIHQTRDAIFVARKKELKQYGITNMESAILYFIQAIGYEATPAQISRFILRKPHTVSEHITRMHKKGLVRKVKSLQRKNSVLVVLTEKGLNAYQHSTKRQSIRSILSLLNEEQRQQMLSCFKLLRNGAFQESGMKVPPLP